MDDRKEYPLGHSNPALEMEDECSTPKSNNNRSIKNGSAVPDNDDSVKPRLPVVFEDLPYEPSFVMDKIEQFWISVALFLQIHQRPIKLVSIAVLVFLYNCYFFGAIAYFVQYKVRSHLMIFTEPIQFRKGNEKCVS